jgi:hypothetical protein
MTPLSTMTKISAALTVALAASLFLNLKQYGWAVTERATAKTEMESAVNAARAEVARAALDTSQRLVDAAREQSRLIAEEEARLAAEQLRQQEDYWRRMRALQPLPAGCGPGQDRVDAFNERGSP